jgi:hypothetical protein
MAWRRHHQELVRYRLKINLKLIKNGEPAKIRGAGRIAARRDLKGARALQLANPAAAPSIDQQPLRLLLVRSRPGELPWLATTIAKTMAPVEIVQVVGFANAIWRLGNETFDSVLLDVEVQDPAAMAYFREQIAQVAAVPVLDLRESAGEEAAAPAPAGRAARRAGKAAGEQAQEKGARRGLRVPWQRRPRRAPPAADPEPLSATG